MIRRLEEEMEKRFRKPRGMNLMIFPVEPWTRKRWVERKLGTEVTQ